MKKSVVIAFTLFVVAHCRNEYFDHLKRHSYKKVKEHYHLKKNQTYEFHVEAMEERCPGYSDKLEKADKEFLDCVGKIDDSLTLCEMSKPFLLNCTKPLEKITDDCLPEEEKGTLSLIYHSWYSTIHHLCKIKGETIFELFDDCLWDDLKTSNPQLDRCKDKITQVAVKYKRHGPRPQEMCTDFTEFRPCIKSRVEFSCKNPHPRKALLGVFDAIIEPCHDLKKL